jgi:septal ring-binding cell division protein DamX
MDTKQKSLLVLTVAALGFLGYQVFQLVDRDITETPIIAQQTQGNTAVTAPVVASHSQPSVPVVHQVEQATSPPAVVSKPTLSVNNTVTPQQHAYMKALNSYEVARMHHQLMDEEAAIASAQQKIVVMHNKTEKILGPNSAVAGDGFLTGQSSSTIGLSYIDKRNGAWSATLHIGSDYEPVQVGSTLANGYDVIGIDHQGVTLQKGSHREVVNFNGTTQLPNINVIATAPHLVIPNEQQRVAEVTKTVKVTHGVLGEQANLLATQLVHHGSEMQAIARHGLSNTPLQPQVVNGKAVMPKLEHRSGDGLPYQISIHDRNADEAEDDFGNTQLSMDLHLRSVEIMPVMNQPYNTDAYLPQQADVVPQNYHLVGGASVSDEQQYAAESSDTDASQVQKVALTQNKIFSLPSQYYTIQLLGSAHPQIVSKFVHQNDLQKIALTISVGTHEHPWVIALYGVYPSFDKAEEKLVHLSSGMRMGGAWIRRIGDVQKVVKGQS